MNIFLKVIVLFIITFNVMQVSFAIENSNTHLFQKNSSLNNKLLKTIQQSKKSQKINFLHYIDGYKVILIWDIPNNFYLYKKQFKFKLKNAPKAIIGIINFPNGEIKQDQNFGKQVVYSQQLSLSVPIYGKTNAQSKLNVYYQGCNGDICLPIQKTEVNLKNLNSKLINKQEKRPYTFLTILTFIGIGILLSFTPVHIANDSYN